MSPDRNYVTLVAGFPRSGSTLMMRMLAAGGIPAHADSDVSMESGDVNRLADGHTVWLRACRGKAVKILDAVAHVPLMLVPYRVILMHRNHREQARSFLKFGQWLGMGADPDNRADVRRVAKSFDQDFNRLHAACRDLGPTFIMDFENVLDDPATSASQVCGFLDLPAAAATPAMAGQVIPRQPECLPYMLEERLQSARIAR